MQFAGRLDTTDDHRTIHSWHNRNSRGVQVCKYTGSKSPYVRVRHRNPTSNRGMKLHAVCTLGRSKVVALVMAACFVATFTLLLGSIWNFWLCGMLETSFAWRPWWIQNRLHFAGIFWLWCKWHGWDATTTWFGTHPSRLYCIHWTSPLPSLGWSAHCVHVPTDWPVKIVESAQAYQAKHIHFVLLNCGHETIRPVFFVTSCYS